MRLPLMTAELSLYRSTNYYVAGTLPSLSLPPRLAPAQPFAALPLFPPAPFPPFPPPLPPPVSKQCNPSALLTCILSHQDPSVCGQQYGCPSGTVCKKDWHIPEKSYCCPTALFPCGGNCVPVFCPFPLQFDATTCSCACPSGGVLC